jgi:hypothetical protein
MSFSRKEMKMKKSTLSENDDYYIVINGNEIFEWWYSAGYSDRWGYQPGSWYYYHTIETPAKTADEFKYEHRLSTR